MIAPILAASVRLVAAPYKDNYGFARASAVIEIKGDEIGAKVILQVRLSAPVYGACGRHLLACGEGDLLLVSGKLQAEWAYCANNTRVPVMQFDVERLAPL
ncbi:hypothetical protein [Citrobacter portucalensis]|uniref:hypothetical protein n=1 Tax=Citrobacter portucalensis TaxID=1639133 RepID=UPI00226B0D59|nr:hypothetical protein [Citrobacter portucalensis]MCX8985133.1 hypothetical protein [Citrobacter portucalensis]